ncbi:molybdenum cofactor guanylyltransferase [Candidatus Nitrospira nitrificans]|uniref:Probable molybdenum cofactor guanylyltransferase n=1 Tax=Candidatus Nitrospira nitrificans TaxID=1742973 RepID=A0A0S4LXZ3_9BACT|nr:molybdenum cofactor guanylyltransferase [Candidatus Nitrospira nitrificans]CUS39858.1 Molybdenum cofactor guanylyltransferase [Candidatus Nitrospira nitrificans]
MITDVTGVLLAGGKSKRMGEDKRFVLVGQQTLFDRSCAVLRELFSQVCVVIAQDSPSLQADVSVVRDLIPDYGSLGGLYTGLRLAKTQHIFLAACDMPFLNSDVIRHMVQLKDPADIVISRWATRLQPTHAVYSRNCLPVIEEMMTLHNRKIHSMVEHPALRVWLVPEAEIRQIDQDGHSLFNINTPPDLEQARSVCDADTRPGS